MTLKSVLRNCPAICRREELDNDQTADDDSATEVAGGQPRVHGNNPMASPTANVNVQMPPPAPKKARFSLEM